MNFWITTALIGAAVATGWTSAQAKLVGGGPDPIEGTRSLADIIDDAGSQPVHIIYVHGMRAEGPGASKSVRERVANFLRREAAVSSTQEPSHYLKLGPRPKAARIGDPPRFIWKSDTEWLASQPFVDRYILSAGAKRIVIDEVNWWPLLFPLKCRFLLKPEHHLSGNDVKHLHLCAKSKAPYYPWITKNELEDLLREKPASGGGAWPNSPIKRQIINWGLSDAVIALGPMRGYLIDTMNQAFGLDAPARRQGYNEHVVMSESLGSFVVLDALQEGASHVEATFSRTHNLYFFANQFALLELARIVGLPARPGVATGTSKALRPSSASSPGSPLAALAKWTPSTRPRSMVPGRPAPVSQIVAFSDPSDMLSYRMPRVGTARVVNVYVPETGGPFRLFANPVKAHRGHITSSAVWTMLLTRTPIPHQH